MRAPIEAQAVGALNMVTVSPDHGRVAAQFQVTYAISPCTQAAGVTIGFSWNGLTPAGQFLGTAATDSSCRATLTTRPPASAATPGTYQVFGYVALPTGAPAPNTEASTTYTVDVTPTATARSSATASSLAATTPSASAPADTAAPSSAPAGSDQPGATGTAPAASKGTTLRFSPTPDWWTLSWPVVAGVSVLALGVLAALAFTLLWPARRRRARPTSNSSNDKAA